MNFGPEQFKAVLGRFATGVAVVTTCDGTRPVGITVNAFASVSLDPPLVLVCIDRTSYVHDLLLRTGYFAVNLLSADQASLSDCFAGRSEARLQRFCDVAAHTAVTGAPVLDVALGYVDCRVTNVFPGGDHSIFLGHVVALAATEEPPLLYYRGVYTRLDEARP